jgi:hypothetical protein
VSWNGGGFDLPVMHYRGLIHGVKAARAPSIASRRAVGGPGPDHGAARQARHGRGGGMGGVPGR